MAWLTDAEDSKMQMNVHFLMNIVVNNLLDLNLVDVCLDSTLQVSYKSLNTL